MIVDYASGEQLINIIKQKQNVLEKREVKYILKEILKGLEIIHFSKILHRDLKPQNIIVDILNKKVKIIDFGLALYTPKAQLKDFKRCGTMGYMAPQIVNNRGQHKKIYNQKCDIFSFGIIAHMLMVGRNPIKGKNYNETQFNNQHCNFKLEKIQIVKKYGQYGYKFLSACLEKQPEKRPSAFQLLNSKFLSSSSNSFSHSNVSQRINKDELLHKNQNRNSNQIQKQNIENCKYNLKYFDQNNHLKKQTFNHQNNDDDKDKDIDKYINIDMDIEIDIPLDKIQKPRHQSIIKKRTFFI